MSNCNWSLAIVEATSEHWWVTHTVERNMRTKQWCHILSSNTSIIVTWGLEFVCARRVFERRGFCGGGVRGPEGGRSPCSCPKMKEASQDKNSQTWKRRVEREELGKGREVGGNLNWLHLSGDLNSAHGGLAVLPSVSFLCSFENLSTSMSHVVCKFTGLGSAGCVWL